MYSRIGIPQKKERKKSQLIPDETKLHDNKPLFIMSKGTQNRQAAHGLG